MFKRSKHGNKKVIVDGEKFDSLREFARWNELRKLERAREIGELRRQVVYVLAPSVVLGGRKKPAWRYVADFVYRKIDPKNKNGYPNGEFVIEDCKSPHLRKDPVFRAKQHMMKHVHGIDILLT
jgi:hypothetical protein